MLTITVILVLAAFILTIGNATRPVHVPLWAPVLLLCLLEMLRIIPLR